MKKNQTLFVISVLVPITLVFLIVFAYPVFSAFYISLTDMKLLSDSHNFIGFGNYIKVFNDPIFRKSFYNTVYFTFLYLSLNLIISLALALYINSLSQKFQSIVKIIIFLPVIVLTVASILTWGWMYVPSFGIINYFLSFFHIGPLNFLTSSRTVIPSIVVMTLWKWLGINTIIFLAGIQSIPEEYFEAARIDGAKSLNIFTGIILPLLKPTMEYISVTTIFSSMQVFAEVFVLTSGGPGTSSRVLTFHIYEVGFKFLRIGEASTIAFLLFIFILMLTIFQFRLYRRSELY